MESQLLVERARYCQKHHNESISALSGSISALNGKKGGLSGGYRALHPGAFDSAPRY